MFHVKLHPAFHTAERLRITAGDKNLPVVDVVEDIILPGCIKLAHHIVEQGDGLFPGHGTQERRLRELERKNGRTLLALGSVYSGRQAGDLHLQVIPVGTGRREPGRDIRIPVSSKKLV